MSDNQVTLAGSTPPNTHQRIGPADPKQHVDVTIKLRRKTEDGLPTMAEFLAGKRAHLTRQELGEKYGASADDAEAVGKWAESQGLTVTRADLPRRQLHLAGTVDSMGKAFGVTFSTYLHQRTQTKFRSHDENVQVPQSLAPIIQGVFGLSDMPIVRRPSRRRARTEDATVSAAPAAPRVLNPAQRPPGSFFPNEVAKLYNFPATQGNGQKVAILEFGGGFDQAQLTEYFTTYIGLPASPVVNAISVLNTTIAVDQDVTGEVYLDIEVVGGMAPKAIQDVYFAPWTGAGFLNAIDQAVHADDYAAVSISYGLDEDTQGNAQNPGWTMLNQNVDEGFRDAVAVGIPVFVSSGDQGSSSGRGQVQGNEVTVYEPQAHAGYPASSPYAIAVGGTMLYAKNGAITNEVVWNELGQLQNNQYYWGGATGGGVSDRYTTVPSYQSGAGVTAKSANTGAAGRALPDVAGNAGASTGYLVTQPPGAPINVMPVGGTSAAAPMWAALMACVGESLTTGLGGKIPVYFLNDFIYANGTGPAFRDIVGGISITYSAQGGMTVGAFTAQGNNQSSKAAGYTAQKGFDCCTGWGSPNGAELLSALGAWLAKQPA